MSTSANPSTFDRITAPHIAAVHGFLGRSGGVSTGPYASLNLGLSSGDAPALVAQNRERVLAALGVAQSQVCAFDQVHGSRVLIGSSSWFEEEADAAVTNNPDVMLVVSVADCAPLLFYDPVTGSVGAAHCGWRGTLACLAAKTVLMMQEHYGTKIADVRVALGMCIRKPQYQVGAEVVAEFQQAGFPETLYSPDAEGRYRLDIAGANIHALTEIGIDLEHIWDAELCTYQDSRFFSYRRDKGKTGRHWAFIRALT